MGLFHNLRILIFLIKFIVLLILLPLTGVDARPLSIDWNLPLRPCGKEIKAQSKFDYLASDNDQLFAISSSTGILNMFLLDSPTPDSWQVELGSTVISEPLQNEGGIFVITKADDAKEYSEVRRISKLTGITSWIRKLPFSKIISASLMDNQLVLTGVDARLMIESETGDQISPAEAGVMNLPSEVTDTRKFSDADKGSSGEENQSKFTAILRFDGSVYFGDGSGSVTAQDMQTGKEIWNFKTGGQISSISRLNGNLLVGSFDNFLYFLNAGSGNLKWKKRFPYRLTDRPVHEENIIIVSSAGNDRIFVLEQDSGKIINQITLPEPLVVTSPADVVNGKIYIGTNSGIKVFGQCEPAKK